MMNDRFSNTSIYKTFVKTMFARSALRVRARLALILAATAVCLVLFQRSAGAQTSLVVNNPPPPNKASGSTAILTGGGFGSAFNFKPYAVPGQLEDPGDFPCIDPKNKIYFPGSPYALSYANPGKQPVQSSDWWSSLGFQSDGWVLNRGGVRLPPNQCFKPTVALAGTAVFYSEPFQLQLVDFNEPSLFPDFTPEAGLRIWNTNNFQVAANTKLYDFTKNPPALLGYNTNLDQVSWGFAAPAHEASLTVGLDGVHPLRVDEFPTGGPKAPPWTNILVESYSDWGVVASVHDKGNSNQLNITMANGSPFVWFERTKGSAPFDVWMGGIPLSSPKSGSYDIVENSGPVMVVKVKFFYNGFYNPPGQSEIPSESYYAIQADRGTWIKKSAEKYKEVALYQNSSATSVIVTALPHNIHNQPGAGQISAKMAWSLLQPYACLKTVDTKLILPTPAQTVSVNGQSLTLGYDQNNATVTGQLQITNAVVQGFASQCTQKNSFQLAFPNHRKSLVGAQQSQLFTQQPQPQWNSLLGPVIGYVGNTMYLQNSTRGIVPMLPSVAIDNPGITNPASGQQTAAEDIYDTLKAWYFVQEPQPGKNQLNSFGRNPSTYMGVGFNTYLNFTTTLRELVVVADQLAQTSNNKIKGVMDPQLGETKDQAAAEMRDFILHTLEEMIGQWFDVYTANLLEYNPVFNTMYGYPDGFFAVGHLSDHHYHYGYFLRAAALIGRYDPLWLNTYIPVLKELLLDVAAFDNGASGYPQLRNFNPYYGHSWADGQAYGGNNQESTSEAINFEVGMIELGEQLNLPQWRDLGLYLYEQEILATQQYFFNQDADLKDTEPDGSCPAKAPYTLVKSTPPVCYNGNVARDFVSYRSGVNKKIEHHTFVTRVQNADHDRTTFFDDSPIAAYTIEWIPASPQLLYLERNVPWLQATWQQFVTDDALYQGQSKLNPSGLNVYQDVAATVQGLLPASGSGMTGTGLASALARINNPHPAFPAAMNTEAKYMAYTLSALGQLDASYSVTSPDAAAFKSSGANSFVVYNPTKSPISVTFKGGSGAGPFTVPPFTEQTYTGGGTPESFKPGNITVPSNRLYFHKNGTLTTTPGSIIVPAAGTYTFPAVGDFSLLDGTMTTVPVRSDVATAKGQFPAPPLASDIVTWMGRFSGSLIGAPAGTCSQESATAPVVCDPTKGLQSVSRFEVYTNDCLNAGWQNCTPNEEIGNNYSMQVLYFFDTTKCDPISGTGSPCNADRVEFYGGVPVGAGTNTWSLENKTNEYYYSGVDLGYPGVSKSSGFNGSFGLNLGLAAPGCTGQPISGIRFPVINTLFQNLPGTCTNTAGLPAAGMFWQNVANGAIVINMWGGVQVAGGKAAPVPVSVDTAPVIGRASWFQPPYQ